MESGQTLLFAGDSITDCDRRDPAHAPLGRGYVRQLHDLLIVRNPEISLRILNRGIGGNTVDDLRSRWQDDVLAHGPDHLVINVGINDLNQFLCQPDKAFLAPDGFGEIYQSLLARTRSALPGTRILLLSPFLISTDRAPGSYRAKILDLLPAYQAAARDCADHYQASFLDLHELFQRRLLAHHPDLYCPEPIHPNSTGQALIAEAVYQALTT